MRDVVDYEILSEVGSDLASTWHRARRYGRGSPYRTATAETLLRTFHHPIEWPPGGCWDSAELTRRLKHPNLWGPTRWAEEGRTCELARMWGWSLTELLQSAGPIPVSAAVCLTRDLCAAMTHLHETTASLGLGSCPHGRVLPMHILVSTGGSSRIEEPFGARQTAPRGGETNFDLPFLPPEQARGRSGGRAADVYQLGLLLYAMLAGGSPLRRETSAETILAAAACDLTPLERADVPPMLSKVLRRALSPTVTARPPSARELDWNLELVELAAEWGGGRDDLLRYVADAGLVPRLAPLATPRARRSIRRPNRQTVRNRVRGELGKARETTAAGSHGASLGCHGASREASHRGDG